METYRCEDNFYRENPGDRQFRGQDKMLNIMRT